MIAARRAGIRSRIGPCLLLLGLICCSCGRGPGDNANQAGAPIQQGSVGTPTVVLPTAAAAPYPAGFVLLVIEDRAGQLRVSSGQVGELARLSPRERQAVQRAWLASAPRQRPGVYCAHLLDPLGTATAHRCFAPQTRAHLAPRDGQSGAAEASLDVIAFALRLPWPATATGGDWRLTVGAPDGRSASWRPRR